MNKRSGWKQVTEAEFNQTKVLQEAGLSPKQTFKVTGRGVGTVHRMYKAKDFEDYRKVTEVATGRNKQKPSNGEVQKTQYDRLERIAIALEALVEAWNSKPAERQAERKPVTEEW